MSEPLAVKGLTALQALFKEVPLRFQRQVLRKGPSAGSLVLKNAVTAAAPVAKQSHKRARGVVIPPGTLKRSVIRVFKREDSNDNQAVFAVTIRQGKRAQSRQGKRGLTLNRDAFYAAWVERGHKIVGRNSKGGAALRLAARRKAAGGSVPAHPFFEPAVRASATAAADAMTAELNAQATVVINDLTR